MLRSEREGQQRIKRLGVKRKFRKPHKESKVEDNSTETNQVKRDTMGGAQEDIVKPREHYNSCEA